MTPLIERGDLTLNRSDIEVLSLHTTRKLTGEIVCEDVENALKRIGGSAVTMTTDQGSDMKRGGRLLQVTHPEMKCIYEVPHKLALVVKHTLEDHPVWLSYLAYTSETIPLIQQTELAAIKPPNIRTKGRYMSFDIYVKWYMATAAMIAAGHLQKIGISEERFKEYFWWFDKFTQLMKILSQMVWVLNTINHEVRTKGISEETYKRLLNTFALTPIEDKEFLRKALNAVNEEVQKLEPGQVVQGSTEAVEAFIGQYKTVGATSGQGINSHALAMGNLIGKHPDMEEIKKAMEGCPIKQTLDRVKEAIGGG